MSRHLFTDTKSRKQIAIFRKYRNMAGDEANSKGLARWRERNDNGAWEHQNFVDNFGTEDAQA